MEKDDEVKGSGNSYTTHFRQYDPRIVRWTSLDPAVAKYPNQSPCVAFNNNPIFYTDPFGDDPPEKLSGGQKFKNWISGNSYKNKANNYAVENNIDVKNISASENSITISEYNIEKVDVSFEDNMQTQEYALVQTTMTFDKHSPSGWDNEITYYSDGTILDRNWASTAHYRDPNNPLNFHSGAASSAGFSDIAFVPLHGVTEDGFVGLGMDRESANTASNWTIGVGSFLLGRSSTGSLGYGYKLGEHTEILYRNPNVGGGTIFSYLSKSTIFRLDAHFVNYQASSKFKFHYHYASRSNFSSNRQFQKEAAKHKRLFTGTILE